MIFQYNQKNVVRVMSMLCVKQMCIVFEYHQKEEITLLCGLELEIPLDETPNGVKQQEVRERAPITLR